MAEKCLRCFRPMETCYCRYIKPVESGIKFVFLMHPKEAYKQKTGTGRLAQLSLPGSEIIIGIDFTQNRRLLELLSDERYYPVVMYPGPDAWTAAEYREEAPHTLRQAVGGKTLLVILVDATWPCARKMLRLSPNVTSLQKISFTAGYSSEYTFKREPKPDYLSTIETCYYLLKELNDAAQPAAASAGSAADSAQPAVGGVQPSKTAASAVQAGAVPAADDGAPSAEPAGSAPSAVEVAPSAREGAPASVWNGTCDPEPLIDVFRKMVRTQLDCQKERINSGEPDRYQVAGGIRAKRRERRQAAAAAAMTAEKGAPDEQ